MNGLGDPECLERSDVAGNLAEPRIHVLHLAKFGEGFRNTAFLLEEQTELVVQLDPFAQRSSRGGDSRVEPAERHVEIPEVHVAEPDHVTAPHIARAALTFVDERECRREFLEGFPGQAHFAVRDSEIELRIVDERIVLWLREQLPRALAALRHERVEVRIVGREIGCTLELRARPELDEHLLRNPDDLARRRNLSPVKRPASRSESAKPTDSDGLALGESLANSGEHGIDDPSGLPPRQAIADEASDKVTLGRPSHRARVETIEFARGCAGARPNGNRPSGGEQDHFNASVGMIRLC